MSWQRLRLTDLFALFFDPKVPVLFLVGSIMLAVIGNGVYDLLLQSFGTTLPTVATIVVTATLILIGVTLGFWVLVHRYRVQDEILVPPEQEAQPHTGLILTVGPDPQSAARSIMEWHLKDATLRHCWLMVTPSVEQSQHYKDLRYWLIEQNVVPHVLLITDPEQVDASYTAVKQAIMQARQIVGDKSIIVDITGGLKPMTAGMVLACRELSTAMQYLKARRDDTGRIIPHTARPMMVEVKRVPPGEETKRDETHAA